MVKKLIFAVTLVLSTHAFAQDGKVILKGKEAEKVMEALQILSIKEPMLQTEDPSISYMGYDHYYEDDAGNSASREGDIANARIGNYDVECSYEEFVSIELKKKGNTFDGKDTPATCTLTHVK